MKYIRWVGLFVLIVLVGCFYASEIENLENRENIHYYVITLRSEDRMQNIEQQQHKISSTMEIVDGVVGKNLTESEIRSMQDPVIEYAKGNIDHIKKNEIGCYLSHYRLYQKIAAEPNASTYSVVLEDDFVINRDFESELRQALDKIHDFDILYLYLTGHTQTEKKSQNVCVIDHDMNLYGITGYVVKNQNIHKLLDVTKVMKEQIDVQLQNAIHAKKLEAYKFCPYIVNVSGLPSTIQTAS